MVIEGCGGVVVPRSDSPPATVNEPTATPAVSPTSAAPGPPQPRYRVSCGPVTKAGCDSEAARIVTAIEDHDPSKRVVWVALLGAGDYQVHFDDGTAMMAISN